jgi:GNAT superfamily N-acetyltransferase
MPVKHYKYAMNQHDFRRWIVLVESELFSKAGLQIAIKTLSVELESRYPGLELWASIGPSFELELHTIVVPKGLRERGTGTAAMQALIAFADKHQLIMVLSPANDFGGSVSRLIPFYQRFGFVPNKGRHKDWRFRSTMIRQPKPLGATPDGVVPQT